MPESLTVTPNYGGAVDRRGDVRVEDSYAGYCDAVNALTHGVYHRPAWHDALAVYKLKTHWLTAMRGKVPVGSLPVVLQSSHLFGVTLTSLPWVDEAGPSGDPSAVAALVDHAVQLAKQRRCELLLKLPITAESIEFSDEWRPAAGDKVLLRRRLAPTADELWTELSAKVRNQVRKGEKSGLDTERGGGELVDEFFSVYSRNMRDLGSPSHSRRFFAALVDGLEGRASVYCTRHEGVVVGAGIVLDNRPSLDIPWASSLREYNSRCVNHAMYWRILADACEAGYDWFHFGRSSIGSGQHKFKMQWGAEEAPLNWLTYAPNASRNPAEENGDRFGLAQQLWKKLPLWASRRLGPHVIRLVS